MTTESSGNEITQCLRARANRPAALDAQKSELVELRYFGGLSVEETAEALGVSTKTVTRDWKSARAWLYRELKGRTSDGS